MATTVNERKVYGADGWTFCALKLTTSNGTWNYVLSGAPVLKFMGLPFKVTGSASDLRILYTIDDGGLYIEGGSAGDAIRLLLAW